jgi:uncharacterized protein with von Willebrand factor type A (vWA) domain
MQRAVLAFANTLRKNGIRISVDEVMSALTGIELIDLASRTQFKTVLKATWIKSAGDIEEFNRLFELFFADSSVPEEALSESLAQGELQEALQEVLDQANGALSPEFRQMILEGIAALAATLPEIAERVGLGEIRYPLQTSHFAQKIRRELGMDYWAAEADHLLSLLEQEGASEQDREVLEAGIVERTDLFAEMIRDYVGRQAESLIRKDDLRDLPRDIMEKGFGALTPWEIQAMREAIREMVQKIRDESALRQKRRQRGRFDIKHTLRRSLAYGGIPVEVAFRKRKKSKTRIVTLCDVSSSVWNASRFMLHLLYSLQDQFDKVRSFVFVDKLGEVTECFEQHEVNEAIETALNQADIPYNRYTDYGSVFKQFFEDYMDAVNRKTTFIVIGDGRNNFFVPGEEYLARVRSRARRTIWLNPENRGFWKFGDSMMHRYAKQCDEVRECRNLKQLVAFINDLTL